MGLGEELQRIDFSANAGAFAGTNLTVTATRTVLGGDGLVNVGYIDAGTSGGGSALDLGLIVIRGDLGRIDAGGAALGSAAVKGLTVNSMGLFSTTTQEAGGDLRSDIAGALRFLKVTGSFHGAQLHCGSVGAIAIGGDLVGGSALGSLFLGGDHSGFVAQQIGSLKIGGATIPLTAGPGNDLAGLLIGLTADLRVREV